jgi:HK97 gp10 family phage protein
MFGAEVVSDLAGIEAFFDRFDDQVALATNEVADDLVLDMQANWSGYYPPASAEGETPAIRSGFLDQSVAVASLATPTDAGCEASVRVTAAYAGYLEFGTSIMAARPFIRPAVFKMRGRVVGYYRKALKL